MKTVSALTVKSCKYRAVSQDARPNNKPGRASIISKLNYEPDTPAVFFSLTSPLAF